MLGLIEESGKVVKDVKNIEKKVTEVKLHIFAYSCIFLHILTYSCVLECIGAY